MLVSLPLLTPLSLVPSVLVSLPPSNPPSLLVRRNSILTQGLGNSVLNFALFFETALAAGICYLPFMNDILNTRPLPFKYWLCGMPFALYIFAYDEARKWWVRGHPGGWLAKNTSW